MRPVALSAAPEGNDRLAVAGAAVRRRRGERRCGAGRWWGLCAGLVLWICGPLASFADEPKIEVYQAKPPLVVEIELGSLVDALSSESSRREPVVSRAVRRLMQAGAVQSERMLTLKVADHTLEFKKLSAADRQAAGDVFGSGPERHDQFERAMCGVLLEILSQAKKELPDRRLSVLGLPFEDGVSAARSNQNYLPLIQMIDAVVSPKRLIAVGSSQRASSAVREDLPLSLAHAGDRPIFFRVNRRWTMAVPAANPRSRRAGSTVAPAASGAAEDVSETLVLPPPPLPGADPDGPAQLLMADWGEGDSPWDLNGDGVVDVQDLIALILQWEDVVDPSDSPDQPIARFVNVPDPFLIGTSGDIELELLAGGALQANVIFQVWSAQSDSVEVSLHDASRPFILPAGLLGDVPAGPGTILAMVRDGQVPIGTITESVTFVQAGSGTSWAGEVVGGNGDQIAVAFFDDTSAGGPGDPAGDDPPIDPGEGGGSGGGAGWGDPDAPSPEPVIHVLDNSGMAPFAAHVHALDSTIGVGDSLTARYRWDFGDPEAPYDQLEGFNAAHVYDTPGTYTITLTIMNEAGRESTATAQITVTADTRTPIYVSADGNDEHDGRSIEQPIRTFARAIQLLNHEDAVLFRRGDVFDVSLSVGGINRRGWLFGAYGTGEKPVLRWTGPMGYNTMIGMNEALTRDVVVQDLKFDSIYASSPDRNITDAIVPDGENITIRNCTFGHVTDAVNCERQPVGVLTVNNDAPIPNAVRAYYVWVQGTDHTHIGNTVNRSLHEHNIRIGGAQRVLLAHNDFTNLQKTTIWLMQGEDLFVRNNTLNEGQLAIGPDHNGPPTASLRRCVVEANVLDKRQDSMHAGVKIKAGAEHVYVRNNLVLTTGHSTFEVTEYLASMDRSCQDIRIVNNTGINNGSGRFLRVGADNGQLVVANNLYVAPEMETGSNSQAIMFILDDDLGSFSMIANNCWPVPQVFEWVGDGYHYLWPTWSEAEGYRNIDEWADLSLTEGDVYENIVLDEQNAPPAACMAIGHATRIPGVYTDLSGELRPDSGVWTAGAVEP